MTYSILFEMLVPRHVVRMVATATVGASLAYSNAFSQEVAPGAARAQALGVGLSAGGTWSDNVLLAPTDEASGGLAQVGMNLFYNQKAVRLRSNVDLNAAYQHYLDDEFSDHVVGGVDGTMVLGIVPERIEWFFKDNFGQTTVDSFRGETPDNRENVNYFTTGPTLTSRLGQSNSVSLSGRYSRTDYEITDLQGDRYNASLALLRQLSAASIVSLNASGERLRYDGSNGETDYKRYEGYGRYEIESPRTNLGLDLGYTALRSAALKSQSNPLVRLSLGRRVSPSSTLSVKVATEFSDSGNSLRAAQGQGGVRLRPESVLATAEAFERRAASLGWDFNRNRTTLGLNGEYVRELYVTTGSSDRTLSHYGAYFGRQLTEALRFRLDGRYSIEKYELNSARVEDLQGTAALIVNAGRTLSFRFQYDYVDRSGEGALAIYTQNRASVFVTWTPVGSR